MHEILLLAGIALIFAGFMAMLAYVLLNAVQQGKSPSAGTGTNSTTNAGIGGAISTESGRYPLIFVSSVPSGSGPPQIEGIPVGALLNVTLSMPVWEVALLTLVVLAIPFVAVYGVWLYVNRRR